MEKTPRMAQIKELKMSIYTDLGYENRKEYLISLAEDYEIEKETVFSIAYLLGSNEDFDGLINAIEDYTEKYYR